MRRFRQIEEEIDSLEFSCFELGRENSDLDKRVKELTVKTELLYGLSNRDVNEIIDILSMYQYGGKSGLLDRLRKVLHRRREWKEIFGTVDETD